MMLFRRTYLDLGKTIFLFFVAMTTVMVVLAPGSCHWDGGSGGDGRTMETCAVEDPRSSDTRAS
jgi:hypothetical protein